MESENGFSAKMKVLMIFLCLRCLQQVSARVLSQEATITPDVTTHAWNHSEYEYEYEPDWPKWKKTLGSVSAVAIAPSGNVVIFHRASHVWDLQTFDAANKYTLDRTAPINVSTLLEFASDSGALIQEWGANFFFMPHGLTIDRVGNYWLTDVALHQVFKFEPSVSLKKPTLTLGKRFEPGNDLHSFCKPTAVAVLDSGDFFVADGYCNGRVMKFSPEGRLILSWGKNSFVLTRTFNLPQGPVPENFFAIPHALAYAADRNLLFVADREQGRIQCFNANNGTFHSMYSSAKIGSRLFSVKYSPVSGGLLYVINGPQYASSLPIRGYILSVETQQLVGEFFPTNDKQAFSNPHELAVSEDGKQVYVAELLPTRVHKFRRKWDPPIAVDRKLPVNLQYHKRTGSPSDETVYGDALYASSLTIVSIVVSLLGTSCLVMCVFRTACADTGRSRRGNRFSTASENIALRECVQHGDRD